MIRFNKDLNQWTTEKPCDGTGQVVCKEILNSELTNGAAELVLFCTLSEGGRVGVHQHTENSEAFVILQGEAKVWDGDKEVFLKVGDTNYCEQGNCHGIENVGKGELIYMGIKLPAKK